MERRLELRVVASMLLPAIEDTYALTVASGDLFVSRLIHLPKVSAKPSSAYRLWLPPVVTIPQCECDGQIVSPAIEFRGSGHELIFDPDFLLLHSGKTISMRFQKPAAANRSGIPITLQDCVFAFDGAASIKATLELGVAFVPTGFTTQFRMSYVDHATGKISLLTDPSVSPDELRTINVGCSFIPASALVTRAKAEAVLDTEMRVLAKISHRPGQELHGKRIVVLLHFLDDLLPFAVALLRHGADPSRTLFLHKDYPYPSKEIVGLSLREWGFHVSHTDVTSDSEDALRADLVSFFSRGDEPILVLEDGGYVVPLLVRDSAMAQFASRVIGAVEQTTNGQRRVEETLSNRASTGDGTVSAAANMMRLPFPYLNVAGCEIKRTYEPAFVAEAAASNTKKMLFEQSSFLGRKILVIGAGAIGGALVRYLIWQRAQVYVVDQNPLREFISRRSEGGFLRTGRSLTEVLEMVSKDSEADDYPLLIMGTTGFNSIRPEDIDELPDGTVLVSLSSKQIEFDLKGFQSKSGHTPKHWCPHGIPIGWTYSFPNGSGSKCINVLGYGYPINFVSRESVENKRIDPIMCLLFVALLEAAEPQYLPDRDGRLRPNTPPGAFWLTSWNLNIYTEFVDWLADKIKMFD